MTIYLRSNTQPELLDALRAASLTHTDEDGVEQITTASHNHFISIIGEITRTITPATYDEDGEMLTPGEHETLEGWHANWKGVLPTELAPFVIDAPNNPVAVIA